MYAKSFCRTTLAFLFFLIAYAASQTLCKETCYVWAQEIAVKEINENEQKKLKKHILVITGQPYHTDWFGTLNSSLRKKLFSSLSADSKISYEYIGSESLTDQDYDIKFTDLLYEKYARIKLDMVIAVMPVSSQYILDHGDSIFPQMPVVFVLPSKKQIPIISVRPHSGLVRSSKNAIPETIKRIRTLLPDTRHLVVVSGSDADDLNYKTIAEEYLKDKKWPKTVEYLKGLPAEELAERMEKLPPGSAVLMLTYLIDRNGAPLTTVQIMKAVSERTAAPIFSFYDTVMGLGIVGGKLTSAEAYGETVAEVALKMFKGGPALPLVDTLAEARDIYDWRQIEKWKLPEDRLPQASEIRFKPYSFWRENKGKVILALGLIFLQTILIVMLLFNLMKRKKAEAALCESEKKYRDIFDNAIMGIYQSTPEGKYLNANNALARLFGYSTPEEMLADIDDIQQQIYVNPEERVKLKELFAKQGSVKGFQVEYKRKDHSRFWISITGNTIRDQMGNILYYEGTVEDITQQKLAEIELAKYREHLEDLVRERTAQLEEARMKAESADRLKSAFLATMSHELRTPLNSIIGFTGILLQKLGGPLNEEQEKQLGMVYNSARHLLDLINDVLDISKIEAEQLSVVSESFDLRESIEKVMKSSQPLADKKGLEFSSTVAPEIGAMTSDRRRVEQILLNLISNAIKFTEQGYVRLRGEVRGNDIIIDVQDSGIGIKQEDMGLLFNAFQQIESGITRKYDGTGLGLSICEKLAHLLGGEIRVESEWGKGSTFSLILKKEG